MKLTRHYIEQKIYAVSTVHCIPSNIICFWQQPTNTERLKYDIFVWRPKTKESTIEALHSICELCLRVCVWLTENDKLIQSLPRLSIFITPHILFLCSFSSTATFRGSVLYRLEQKVHSCELHFHLYRIFIASRPSEILFTLRSFTHVSHIAPAPEYVGWFEGSGLSCCSCCFDSFWHAARRRPMVSSRPVSSSSLSLSCSASLARNGKFSTLDGK